MWKGFPVLAKHCTDYERNNKKHLTNARFLSDLTCMKDVLQEASQTEEATLVDSSRYIEQAEHSISSGQFKGVDITGKINRQGRLKITTGPWATALQ